MKRKFYILGLLAILCLLVTGYYAWTLYDAHLKQVAEWNKGAKAAFEEALWMEVNKRAEIPFYSSSSGEHGMTTLNSRIPDSVSVMTIEGFRMYKIDKEKYEQSLIKETRKRARLSTLLSLYPLSVDTLAARWNSLLSIKQIKADARIRYVHTDLQLQNDTIYTVVDNPFHLDSLTISYLGFRCEHEVTAYVAYPHWMASIAGGDGCILLLPWILYVLLFVCYPKLEALAKRILIHKEVIEKTIEVEKEVIVEKEVYVADVMMDKAGVYKLPDGTIFDAFACTLEKDGLQQRLQPQSVSLLKLFLSKSDYKITSADICIKLWGDVTYTERLYSAIRRLRSDLKKVKSELFIETSYGFYELKSPISS